MKTKLQRARLTPLQKKLGIKIIRVAPGIEMLLKKDPYFYIESSKKGGEEMVIEGKCKTKKGKKKK